MAKVNFTFLLIAICYLWGQSRPIRDLRRNDSSGIPILRDSTVTISGIVTVANQFGFFGPGFIQDSTGGVALYDSLVRRLNIGDSITITGRVDFFYGLTELKSLTGLIIHSGANILSPKRMAISELNRVDTAQGYIENEGWLIQIDSVRIVNPPADTFAGDMNYTIEDNQGRRATIRIDRDVTDIVGKRIPSDYFDLTGILSQYDRERPHFGGYQIMPRFWSDLGVGLRVITIAEAIRDLDNNTVPDLLDSTVTVTGIVTLPFGTFSTSRTDIFIQDHTAGVNIFDFNRIFPVELGDSVIVSGTVDQYKGKTQISSPQITVAGKFHRLPRPKILNCRQINGEDFEGSLVRLTGIGINELLLQGNQDYLIFDSSGSCLLRIDGDTKIPGMMMIDDTFSVIGIKSQFSSKSAPPYNDGYQIIPRFPEDFSRNMRDALPLITIDSVQKTGSDGYSSCWEGKYVKVRGRITGPNRIFKSPSRTGFYIQDLTGGVNLYNIQTDTNFTEWLDSIGSEFECIGKVTEYNGLTEIANGVGYLTDSIIVPIQPKMLGFNLPLTESMESDLITVVGDVDSEPISLGGGSNFVLRNGNPGITIRVLDRAMIPLNWITKERRLRVTGIVGQYDTDFPFNTGYQVLVRFIDDLKDTTESFSPAEKLRFEEVRNETFSPSGGENMVVRVNAPRNFKVYLEIFDLEGRLVRRLLTNVPGGFYEVSWDGTDERLVRLPVGIYILNLKGIREDGKNEYVRRPVVIATRLH